MEILKKYLFDVVAVVAFALLAYAYFVPATIDGRILYQHDSAAGRGAGQEGGCPGHGRRQPTSGLRPP